MKAAMLAPEYVIESSGISCGDKMKLYLYSEGMCLFFSFLGDACKIATKAAMYLESYSGTPADAIYKLIARLERRTDLLSSEEWIRELNTNDYQCFLTPVQLLKTYFTNVFIQDTEYQMLPLACDACVSMQCLLPKRNEPSNQKQMKEALRRLKKVDNDEILLQRMGVYVCLNEEISYCCSFFSHIDESLCKKIKKLRLAAPYKNRSEKLQCVLDKRIDSIAMKQIISTNIAHKEVEIVDRYIQSHLFTAYGVKGQRSDSLYPAGSYRPHMDYDYVVPDYEQAFRIISFLINDRDFKMVMDASVPFSFKTVMEENEEILIGHIHLEKILQDSFQVIIDINIGAFPLGRTGVIKLPLDKCLELEDLFCITLAHLFKHEVAFIKDINDLYFILSSTELDIVMLEQRVVRFNLQIEYVVAMWFLTTQMGINIEYTHFVPIEKKWHVEDWPFSRYSHFKIKWYSMLKTCQKKFGNQLGKTVAIRQLFGEKSKIICKEYYPLCPRINERSYLYPIVIFNRYVDVNIVNGNHILNTIVEKEGVYITPVGIFTSSKLNALNRKSILEKLVEILSLLKVDETILKFDYSMSARKDLWLY